jgi:alanyl-tRNA synthetase
MKPEKKIKKQIIEKASNNPEKFYPVKTLESFGLKRYTCKKCGTKFWSSKERDVCGDTNCVGGYTFINNSPAKVNLDFQEVYFKFSEMLKKEGYTPIKRFPVVARWRDDLDFTIASIVGFQPYVVKGIVQPPANPLTVPQICLRFPDIDNVGYTGRHHTGFTMIGQHTFQKPENYKPEEYFKVWFNWYLEGLKIPIDELTVHEDAWAGGGNCGPSLEVFCRGLELGNQVYMMYDMAEATDISDLKELNIKVLDMGMGQERCCWISKGSVNSYEANMPEACNYLFEKTGVKKDFEIYNKFLPYSGMLNLDEVDDIELVWKDISEKIGVEENKLKEIIEPLAGIYSIADHTRTLLYALSDGALPSNVKGGYNLRLIFRRAMDFITKHNWNVKLFDVIKIHAKSLKELYPELSENLNDIKKIIEFEEKKYFEHKEKVKNKIETIIKKGKIPTIDDFIKYYISDGIMPEEIQKGFKLKGKEIQIPTNFYTLITEYFENKKSSDLKQKKNKLSNYIDRLPKTQLLFYEDSFKYELDDAKIIKIIDVDNEKYIVLDKTIFYPTMGGQSSDVGFIGDYEIAEAINVDDVILHRVKK